jgi:hypothetical protein
MKTNDCNELGVFFIDFIDKQLNAELTKQVSNHIEKCTHCQLEIEQLSNVLNELSKMESEQPSNRLKRNFMQMLQHEKTIQDKSKKIAINQFLLSNPYLRVAASFILLIGGVLIGLNLNKSTNNQAELQSLQNEVSEVKQLLIYSKLEQQSPSQRIQAVNYARDITSLDYGIITALINTMNTDENNNVRMAAIQALAKYTDDKLVVEALVQSLEFQKDPLLQITLINILVNIKEQAAIKSMQKLLLDEETHETVRKLAQKGLTMI